MAFNRTKSDVYLLRIMAVMAGVGLLCISGPIYNAHKKALADKKALKQRNVRSAAFANYIIDDITNQTNTQTPSNWAMRQYQECPECVGDMIKQLAADSTKYANALFRDADAVLASLDARLEKEISFDEALNLMKAEPAVQYGPEYKMETTWGEWDDGERVAIGQHPVPTGKMESKGASVVRIMEINKNHLKRKTESLADLRAARAKMSR